MEFVNLTPDTGIGEIKMKEVKVTVQQNMQAGHGYKEAICLAARRHGLAVDTVLKIMKGK